MRKEKQQNNSVLKLLDEICYCINSDLLFNLLYANFKRKANRLGETDQREMLVMKT